jgi:hypothetical protein
MAFPNPGNYGTDPRDFNGRDYALGRHYFGDGGGSDSGGGSDDAGGGCTGCALAIAAAFILFIVLSVVLSLVIG